MSWLIAVVLGGLALALVLYPLYRPLLFNAADAPETGQEEAQDGTVREREQTARVALQEVELDYQLGNIAEPEYRSLRERYMQRALSALRSRYEREQEIDEEIEAQLQELKEQDEKTDN